MSKKQSGTFWGQLFPAQSPHRNRFSLEELHYLRDLLLSNKEVTEANRGEVVEALRSLAEIIIWGDQNDPRFFEFFLESDMLSYIHQILLQPGNLAGEIAKQVLQSLSILIQNIRKETAIFYMFSNNYINDIVTQKFDFRDDEVLGYYINLLKTISLKLNKRTVQFFFIENGEKCAFPVYTCATNPILVKNSDGMVRAAVRTLTLNVYNIDDEAVQRFVVSQPASNYFVDVALYLVEQCQVHPPPPLLIPGPTKLSISPSKSKKVEFCGTQFAAA